MRVPILIKILRLIKVIIRMGKKVGDMPLLSKQYMCKDPFLIYNKIKISNNVATLNNKKENNMKSN